MVTVFGSPLHLHTHSPIHTLRTKELAGSFCLVQPICCSLPEKLKRAEMRVSVLPLFLSLFHRFSMFPDTEFAAFYSHTRLMLECGQCVWWHGKISLQTPLFPITFQVFFYIWFLLCFIKHPFIRFSCSVFIFTLILTHTLFAGWKKMHTNQNSWLSDGGYCICIFFFKLIYHLFR